jgi:hypothetical protein
MREERYRLDVTLGTPDDTSHNVVVLSGVDLDVPLEADLDDDPLHDDELLLEGTDGSFRRLTPKHPDVRLDLEKKLYIYRFRSVPPGEYRLSVRLSDDVWASIATGIRVDKRGASFGGRQLTDAPPPAPPQEPEATAPEEPAAQEAAPRDEVLDPPDYDPVVW